MGTTFKDHLLDPDIHANRPAAGTVPQGTIFPCTTHAKLYQSDGSSTWTDWFSDTGGSGYTPGGTDVAVADGGTGASTASAARTNLGLVIGTDVEAHDADLTAIAGLSPSNDDVLQRKAGAWTNRTMAQLAADLPGGGGSALTVKDEGSNLDTAVTSFDFVGSGVVATNVGHAITVTIAGGGGSVTDDVDAAVSLYNYATQR